jgi:probable selenium-dependent hydroxylase accessory protein YqeC
MNLVEGLSLTGPVRLAIVGAGGKTTALFHLARRIPGPAWVTTTTHLGAAQAALADKHFIFIDPGALNTRQLLDQKVSLVSGPVTNDDRLDAPPDAVLTRLRSLARPARAALLIEADGARQLPLKAPGDHEPHIPDWCEVVIVVAGLSGIGQPLTGQWVHRPEQFAALSRLALGEPITPDALAAVLCHPQGGFKNIPTAALRIALLNQAGTPGLRQAAAALSPRLLAGGYDGVFAGSLRDDPEGGMWMGSSTDR